MEEEPSEAKRGKEREKEEILRIGNVEIKIFYSSEFGVRSE
jgi:hypothetical protein